MQLPKIKTKKNKKKVSGLMTKKVPKTLKQGGRTSLMPNTPMAHLPDSSITNSVFSSAINIPDTNFQPSTCTTPPTATTVPEVSTFSNSTSTPTTSFTESLTLPTSKISFSSIPSFDCLKPVPGEATPVFLSAANISATSTQIATCTVPLVVTTVRSAVPIFSNSVSNPITESVLTVPTFQNLAASPQSFNSSKPIPGGANITASELATAFSTMLSLSEKLDLVLSHQKTLSEKIDNLDKRQQAAIKIYAESILQKENLHNHADTLTIIDFTNKFGITLPMQTKEDFDNLEVKLKNPEIFEAFKLQLRNIDKGSSVTMALTCILKVFMSRNLAMQCNMSLERNNKKVVKDTIFVKTIVDYITNWLNRNCKDNEEKISTKMVMSSFGVVFTNSKDWKGYRAKRGRSQEDPYTSTRH